MKKRLERAECRRHFRGRRRNERRFRERATTRTDPVLAAAQFARREPRTAHALEQLGVNLANEADGHWEVG